MMDRTVLSLKQAVAKRPGMYFGEEGPERLHVLVHELVSNAVDQFLRGDCSRVDVRFDDEGEIEVEDDGPGLPFDVDGPVAGESLATHYLLNHHFTATADGGVPHVHVHQRSGVGVAVVNVACETFVCRSWRNGNCWEQSFIHAEPTAPPQVIARGAGRGTQFRLRPNHRMLETSQIDRAALRASLWRVAHLFAGLVVGCEREIFVAPGGLYDLLHVNYDPTTEQGITWGDRPAFRWSGRHGSYAIDAVACGFARTPKPRCRWHSWVNGGSTPLRGSHVEGFADALKAQGWTPAIAMLHVVAHDARYANPTRDQLAQAEVRDAVRAALDEPLLRYCTEHLICRSAR